MKKQGFWAGEYHICCAVCWVWNLTSADCAQCAVAAALYIVNIPRMTEETCLHHRIMLRGTLQMLPWPLPTLNMMIEAFFQSIAAGFLHCGSSFISIWYSHGTFLGVEKKILVRRLSNCRGFFWWRLVFISSASSPVSQVLRGSSSFPIVLFLNRV